MLWGAFNNASTAMQVFTTDLGSISQNIANVNTTGYKRQEMMFSTMMSESHASPKSYLNGLNIFGVQATQRNLIEAQGAIAPSTTWSDLAINGKGFFMVAPPRPGATPATTGAGAYAANVPTSIDTNDPGAVMYTRDGAWHRAYGPDSDPTLARSYFLNNQGGYLLGWMADDTGTVPSNATLQPVYTLAPRPIPNNGSSSVSTSGTVAPSSVTMPGRATTSADIRANLPRDSRIGGSQTTLSVTDAGGGQQDVTLNWTRTGAYTYTVTASSPHATAWDVNSWDVTVNELGEVTSPVGNQAVNITWDASGGGGAAAANVSLAAPPARGDVHNIPVHVYDSNFNEHVVTMRFERFGTNQWYMVADDGAGGTAASPPVTVTFDDNGKLLTPANGLVSGNFSWTSGTPPVTSTATVALDMSKLSQYSDADLYIGNVDQDGYGKGTLIATTFNEEGELVGSYDNGRTRTLFKVPVANFVSENALEAVSGTMFRRTAAAGEMTVSAIEDAVGEGRFATSALEASTVDIEDEFTRMIMTQKAYSTNAQVFKTADEMTSTARDLKG